LNLDGAGPKVPLCQGLDGNFYGTASGGAAGNGVIFAVSSNGVFTLLYSFAATNFSGETPSALVQTSDGAFYGLTSEGIYNGGTIFKMTTDGTAAGTTVTPLYISGSTQENYLFLSYSTLTPAGLGVFYGVSYGGFNALGAVFKLVTDGTAANTTVTLLHKFGDGDDQFNPDGGNPHATMILASDGNLYGTTSPDGSPQSTVFRISTGGDLRTLYSFARGEDGGSGASSLVEGNPGVFYGVDEAGGSDGFGTVFDVASSGAYSRLYSFAGESVNGSGYETNAAGLAPINGLVRATDGSFYGTAPSGGSNATGTIFRMASGNVTAVFTFPFIDSNGDNETGSSPSSLILGRDGLLYGTTSGGGSNGLGTVFKFDPNNTAPTLPEIVSFSAAGPASAGAPITFALITAPGLNVRVQSTTTTNVEGSWTDLPDGHSGQMTDANNTGSYSLTTTAYPTVSGLYFRAIVSKTGYADRISSPLGPYSLQAVINFRFFRDFRVFFHWSF